MARLVLVHGVATTARIWDGVVPHLDQNDVAVLERPRTGSLDDELAWLTPRVEGSWVIGTSGGATLGLALAAPGVMLEGVIAHEPAVGTLVPHLLAPARAAFAADGTAGLGRALYGASWSLDMAGGVDDDVTKAELDMFSSFQPTPISPAAARVVVTFGTNSPAVRPQAANTARDHLRCQALAIDGVGHFAAYDNPLTFARTILRFQGAPPTTSTAESRVSRVESWQQHHLRFLHTEINTTCSPASSSRWAKGRPAPLAP